MNSENLAMMRVIAITMILESLLNAWNVFRKNDAPAESPPQRVY